MSNGSDDGQKRTKKPATAASTIGKIEKLLAELSEPDQRKVVAFFTAQ